MPEPSLSALEFPRLLRVVQHYAVSDLGRISWRPSSPLPLLPICTSSRRHSVKSRNCVNSNTVKAPSPLPIFPC